MRGWGRGERRQSDVSACSRAKRKNRNNRGPGMPSWWELGSVTSSLRLDRQTDVSSCQLDRLCCDSATLLYDGKTKMGIFECRSCWITIQSCVTDVVYTVSKPWDLYPSVVTWLVLSPLSSTLVQVGYLEFECCLILFLSMKPSILRQCAFFHCTPLTSIELLVTIFVYVVGRSIRP